MNRKTKTYLALMVLFLCIPIDLVARHDEGLELNHPLSERGWSVTTDKFEYYITENVNASFGHWDYIDTIITFGLSTSNDPVQGYHEVVFETDPVDPTLHNYIFKLEDYNLSIQDDGLTLYAVLIERDADQTEQPGITGSTPIFVQKEQLDCITQGNNTVIEYPESVDYNLNLFTSRNNSRFAENETIYVSLLDNDKFLHRKALKTDMYGNLDLSFNSTIYSRPRNLLIQLKCNESMIFKKRVFRLNISVTQGTILLGLNPTSQTSIIMDRTAEIIQHSIFVDTYLLNGSLYYRSEFNCSLSYEDRSFQSIDLKNGTYRLNFFVENTAGVYALSIRSNTSKYCCPKLDFGFNLLKRNLTIEPIVFTHFIHNKIGFLNFSIKDVHDQDNCVIDSNLLRIEYSLKNGTKGTLKGNLTYDEYYLFSFNMNKTLTADSEFRIEIMYLGNSTYSSNEKFVSIQFQSDENTRWMIMGTIFLILGILGTSTVYYTKRNKSEYQLKNLKI